MERQGTRRGPPSKKQVEVWLTTVLNPMSRALAVEESWVTRRNWSFRGYSSDFEFLQPVRTMVAAVYVKNLEQIEDHLPAFAKQTKQHDERLDALRDACRAAHEVILQTNGFLDETADRPNDRPFVAEYLVNSIGDLAGHYVLREYWALHREALYQQMGREPLAGHARTIARAGASFAEVVHSLQEAVDRLIANLADRHKLPRVSPIE